MNWKSVTSDTNKIKDFSLEHIENNDLSLFNILDVAFYNNCGFYLVEHPMSDSPEYLKWLEGSPTQHGKKEILIIITQNKKSPDLDSRSWAYMINREQDNPNFTTCPKRMLVKSENMDERAIAWRKKCFEKQLSKNEHRTALRKKLKLIQDLTKGLVIETSMYGSIIFEQCFQGERSVLIGYSVESPIKRMQFQICYIAVEELESALIKKTKVDTGSGLTKKQLQSNSKVAV